MQSASRRLCRRGLRNAGVIGDPGDHRRRVGTGCHDRGTLDDLSSRAVRTTEPDYQSADRIVVAALGYCTFGLRDLSVLDLSINALGVIALGVYENSVTE
jgi:hypothetical protein